MSYPFNSVSLEHVQALQSGLDKLQNFALAYPLLKPWTMSPMNSSVSFVSTSAAELKAALGSDGWTCTGDYIFKDVDGVRVEMRLDTTPALKPFRL